MKILAVIVTLKAGYRDLEIARFLKIAPAFPLKELENADRNSAAVTKCKMPSLGLNSITIPTFIRKGQKITDKKT